MNLSEPFGFNDMKVDFGDQGQSPLAGLNPMGAVTPTSQSPCLSNEEFESLNKAVQLLRISQLRYIVQKFQIPASGNKTKLLSLVLSIFQSLRYDKVLIDILQEINNLLAQPRDAFTNPLAAMGHLEVVQPDPSYKEPFNPTVSMLDKPFIFGPLLAQPGLNSGQFSFTHNAIEPQAAVCISFLFPEGNLQPFALQADFNGYPIEVFQDDPFPQPIDVTNILDLPGKPNSLNIKNLNCTGSLMICIREYKFVALHEIVNHICNGAVNIADGNVFAVSEVCQHQNPFNLINFLSMATATGKWNCPICGKHFELNQIILSDSPNKSYQKTSFFPSAQVTPQTSQISGMPSFSQVQYMQQGQSNDIFQQQTDLFGNFEWDTF